MKIRVAKAVISDAPTEALVVPMAEGSGGATGMAAILDAAGDGLIRDFLAGGDFTGKPGQIAVLYPRGGLAARRLVLVGVGNVRDCTGERLREAWAAAACHCRTLGVRKFSSYLEESVFAAPPEEAAQAMVEGAILGLYRFTAFKTQEKDPPPEVEEMAFLTDRRDRLALLRAAVGRAEILAAATCHVRDLVSMPANEMTPAALAREARKLADPPRLRVRVLDVPRMGKLGMHALLAVGRGSAEKPCLIVLEYGGAGADAPLIALVGKALTFDSGGICIKPADRMDEMKSDMGGGAAVLGAIQAAAALRLPLRIMGCIPAAENLPSGQALRPGDIVTSLSGQTIEVVNTDAEGRLVLADALTYAVRHKPAALVDLATLTGACVVALGDQVMGMMGTDEKLKEEIRRAADVTGERVWELPLWEHYQEQIKSDVADVKNTGGRHGGAITAGAFLSKFVGGVPWVHLDMAGPVWAAKDRPYTPKGATGAGVRLLAQWLCRRAAMGTHP